MNFLVKIGAWQFEFKQAHGRRVESYGDPFSATVVITVTDGMPHVEGLLAKTAFTREDVNNIEEFIRLLGFESYQTSHFVDGKRTIETKTL